MRIPPTSRAAAALFLGMVLPTRVAVADAKAQYAEASRHYDLREFEAAIEAFRRAYAEDPQPLVLFDIAQCYRQLRDCENARGFYQSYLRNAPDADNRVKVEAFIAEMNACVAAHPPPAAATAPPPGGARPPPAPERTHVLRNLGVASGGLGLVATGVAIYFSFDAQSRANQVAQQCAGGCEASDVSDADRAGRASSRDAIVLYLSGGALLAAGAVMLGVASSRDGVALQPTPGGAIVGGRVHF